MNFEPGPVVRLPEPSTVSRPLLVIHPPIDVKFAAFWMIIAIVMVVSLALHPDSVRFLVWLSASLIIATVFNVGATLLKAIEKERDRDPKV